MEFEFDPAKSELNRQNRGFGFAFAAQIFFGRTLETPANTVGTEGRIGQINELCYAVIYTDRGFMRRIISARRANRKETREWNASE